MAARASVAKRAVRMRISVVCVEFGSRARAHLHFAFYFWLRRQRNEQSAPALAQPACCTTLDIPTLTATTERTPEPQIAHFPSHRTAILHGVYRTQPLTLQSDRQLRTRRRRAERECLDGFAGQNQLILGNASSLRLDWTQHGHLLPLAIRRVVIYSVPGPCALQLDAEELHDVGCEFETREDLDVGDVVLQSRRRRSFIGQYGLAVLLRWSCNGRSRKCENLSFPPCSRLRIEMSFSESCCWTGRIHVPLPLLRSRLDDILPHLQLVLHRQSPLCLTRRVRSSVRYSRVVRSAQSNGWVVSPSRSLSFSPRETAGNLRIAHRTDPSLPSATVLLFFVVPVPIWVSRFLPHDFSLPPSRLFASSLLARICG